MVLLNGVNSAAARLMPNKQSRLIHPLLVKESSVQLTALAQSSIMPVRRSPNRWVSGAEQVLLISERVARIYAMLISVLLQPQRVYCS